jgi:hypothetical protein
MRDGGRGPRCRYGSVHEGEGLSVLYTFSQSRDCICESRPPCGSILRRMVALHNASGLQFEMIHYCRSGDLLRANGNSENKRENGNKNGAISAHQFVTHHASAGEGRRPKNECTSLPQIVAHRIPTSASPLFNPGIGKCSSRKGSPAPWNTAAREVIVLSSHTPGRERERSGVF